MMPIDLPSLAATCAPTVHPVTIEAVVRNESGMNPFAIGVVGGRLVRQPRTRAEAQATVASLERAGWNYSVGIAQVNRANLVRYRLAGDAVFDPCENLRAGSEILADCYRRASLATGPGQRALRAALSCYYSGNTTRGFQIEKDGTSYVQRVVALAQNAAPSPSVGTAPKRSPTSAQASASAVEVPPIAVVRDAGVASAATTSSRRVRRVAAEEEATPQPHRAGWDVFGDFGPSKENRE